MKPIKINILLLLLLCLSQARAQFVEVDWRLFERDSVLPHYATVVELGDDYARYIYSARIEYPEFRPMSTAEIARYGLDTLAAPLPEWPQIDTSVGVSAKKGMLDVSFTPIVQQDGKFLRIESFKLVIDKAVSAGLTASRAAASDRYAPNSVLADGKWVKIRVGDRGVYKITRNDLVKMGFSNPDKVRLFGYGGQILPEADIHNLSDDLQEVPLWREKDYMLFYANGTIRWSYGTGRFVHQQNVYSEYSYYFLNEGDAEPMPFPQQEYPASEASTIFVTYPDYALYEKEETRLCTYGRVLLENRDFSSNRSASYTFDIPGVTGNTAKIDLSFGSNASASSVVKILVNGASVGSLSLSAASSVEFGRISATTFPIEGGLTEKTTVKLTQSVQGSDVNGYLDYIRLNFDRVLALYGSQTNFRGSGTSGTATYKIASANGDTRVWRVTEPSQMTEITGTLSNGTLAVTASASRDEEFVAVNTKGSFPSPTVVGSVANQNLHSLGQTDMVIIVPSNGRFLRAAERLAEAHRLYDGISVAVVTAEQVYNEFSSGTPDATAYRRLMKMLYDRAAGSDDAPKYLLLFGDAMSDNRLLTQPRLSPDDYLLCYESENSVHAVYSYVLEDYFGLLDDNEGNNFKREKVDIGVGRIPAQTQTEADAVVDKIIAYMRNDVAGSWQNVIALLGDDGDEKMPNQHMEDAEGVAEIVSTDFPAFMLDRIYWDEYPMEVLATGNSYPLTTQAIYNRLEKGALVMNYSGHGSASLFSHEMVWKASDMSAQTSPRIPFWVTASCDITPFDLGDGSMGETALLNPAGAAIGLFTTTRTVLQTYNAIINKQFMSHLLALDNGRVQAVGDASRKAKCAVITAGSDMSENKLQYVIIGDPALRLKIPNYKAVVEKFNGKDISVEGNVQAGGSVTVEGHIARPDGSLADEFTGTISPTLFDCADEVTTRDNTGLGTFTYNTHRNTLFAGSDSVVNGRFKITMPVPLDISYSDDYGMLNLFASDTARSLSAQGFYENFTVGGTASSMQNDGKGPQITMYLNTPDFMDGDEVHATPCLYAEIYDENGINTVGSGIGHDIVAMVDNNIDYTYNLNSVFNAEVGDYRRGTIEFTLDALPAGEHTLLLRAWDLYNNSSADTVRFVVVPDLAPDFVNISVSPNPVKYGEKALFTLTHDRPQSEIEVTLEIFNFQGQKLWSVTENTVCSSNVYTYSWDVTAQSGQPMPTGVYIYRARLSSGGSSEQTKTEKIIILNNK